MSVSESCPSPPTFQLGDRVTIRHPSGEIKGRIIELRGPLGPGGAQIYRVLLRRKPHRHVEVRADQLELAAIAPKPL